MKNELINNLNNKNTLCDICKERPKKPIFSKCGHIFCKNCIISQLICKTCNVKLTKTDLTDNPKLKSYTKIKNFEETNFQIIIYPKEKIDNCLFNNYNNDKNNIETDDKDKNTNFSIYNNRSNYNNNPDNLSQLTNKILKSEFKNNLNSEYFNRNFNNFDDNNLYFSNNISHPMSNNEFKNEINSFINNDLISKYNNINLNNQNTLFNNKINFLKKNNKENDNNKNDNNINNKINRDEDSNAAANDEYLISLKDLYIGKKRVHKEFVKGQNNLIVEKNLKKYPLNLNINSIDKYSEETVEFFFDNFVNMFNPNDDIYETKCVIPESDLLGTVRKSKKK